MLPLPLRLRNEQSVVETTLARAERAKSGKAKFCSFTP